MKKALLIGGPYHEDVIEVIDSMDWDLRLPAKLGEAKLPDTLKVPSKMEIYKHHEYPKYGTRHAVFVHQSLDSLNNKNDITFINQHLNKHFPG